MPPKHPPQSSYRNGVGSVALVTGIVALVFAFVPIVGDLVTIPTGIVAVIFGWLGFGRVEKGIASNHREALTGIALGTAALFVVFLVFVATHSPGG
ncbi:hypothetical protein I0Q12_15185 [Rhodococcus sp. CX]|uniref:hypothetical protein n=1 Tax=Rhodococcus sp. CX TaxID=2789880 RepID=UPI0018CF82B0|nr:hypothetical protein [Rhodococcus sp. CX]MBH0120786.1 hypothetical protein [Rhodococcus sp. CX]